MTNSDKMSKQEKAKILAAKKALEDFVFDDFVVGIGTGSTIKYFIEALSELVIQDELEIITVPSSFISFMPSSLMPSVLFLMNPMSLEFQQTFFKLSSRTVNPRSICSSVITRGTRIRITLW